MRFLLLAVLAAALSGCNLIYKLPTRQGNVIEQKEIDQLKVGMTRDQVRFLLGTPLAASTAQPARWDYLGYYKNPRGGLFQRTVSLYFDGDTLARIVGAEAPADGADAAAAAADTASPAGDNRPADPAPGAGPETN